MIGATGSEGEPARVFMPTITIDNFGSFTKLVAAGFGYKATRLFVSALPLLIYCCVLTHIGGGATNGRSETAVRFSTDSA